MNKLINILSIIVLVATVVFSQLTIRTLHRTIEIQENIAAVDQRTRDALKQTIAVMETTINTQQRTIGLCKSAFDIESHAWPAEDFASQVWDTPLIYHGDPPLKALPNCHYSC